MELIERRRELMHSVQKSDLALRIQPGRYPLDPGIGHAFMNSLGVEYVEMGI